MDGRLEDGAGTPAPGVPTWEEIVEQHSDRVYRLAYRLTGNRFDAEDLTQEVFVRVFRSLSTYTPGHLRGLAAPDHHEPLPRPGPAQAADPLRRALRRAGRPAHQLVAEPGRGVRRPHLRRRHRARPRDPAPGLPCRRRALRRRGPQLRGDRRDPRRQARHRPLPHPPRPRDAALRARAPRPRRRTGPVRRPADVEGVVVVMGHLGSRASALLDGQLSPADTERAWEHVHSCHACRDLVEREGWVKTRLAGLTFDAAAPSTPAWLKGSLMGAPGLRFAGRRLPAAGHRRPPPPQRRHGRDRQRRRRCRRDGSARLRGRSRGRPHHQPARAGLDHPDRDPAHPGARRHAVRSRWSRKTHR